VWRFANRCKKLASFCRPPAELLELLLVTLSLLLATIDELVTLEEPPAVRRP
jgi:hypothetical protein